MADIDDSKTTPEPQEGKGENITPATGETPKKRKR